VPGGFRGDQMRVRRFSHSSSALILAPPPFFSWLLGSAGEDPGNQKQPLLQLDCTSFTMKFTLIAALATTGALAHDLSRREELALRLKSREEKVAPGEPLLLLPHIVFSSASLTSLSLFSLSLSLPPPSPPPPQQGARYSWIRGRVAGRGFCAHDATVLGRTEHRRGIAADQLGFIVKDALQPDGNSLRR
jgi:hypothetical protein